MRMKGAEAFLCIWYEILLSNKILENATATTTDIAHLSILGWVNSNRIICIPMPMGHSLKSPPFVWRPCWGAFLRVYQWPRHSENHIQFYDFLLLKNWHTLFSVYVITFAMYEWVCLGSSEIDDGPLLRAYFSFPRFSTKVNLTE